MRTMLFVFFTALVVIITGCSLGGGNGGDGTLILKLTDAPIELEGKVVDQIWVTIKEVRVVKSEDDVAELAEGQEGEESDPEEDGDSNWIVVSEEPQEFDLMTLTDGATAVLGEAELEEGHYDQIRLILEKNNGILFVGDPEPYDLKIPSGTKSGVKITGGFDVVAGEDTEITLDFDAAESVHEKGGGDSYILRPTIKIMKVSEPAAEPE